MTYDEKTPKGNASFLLNTYPFFGTIIDIEEPNFIIGPMTINTGSKTITIDPDYTADNAAREVIEILKKEFFGNVD